MSQKRNKCKGNMALVDSLRYSFTGLKNDNNPPIIFQLIFPNQIKLLWVCSKSIYLKRYWKTPFLKIIKLKYPGKELEVNQQSMSHRHIHVTYDTTNTSPTMISERLLLHIRY